VVRAESEGENRGSRFTFTLPVAVEPALTESTPAELAPVEPFLEGRTVLVVEDEPQTQDLMRLVVEDLLGGVARVCDDGEQAMREAAERPPALILLDLQLPRTDGWEVFNRVRALGLAVPVVLATVVTSARAQAERLGFDAFLAKPFSLDELLAVVGRLTPPAAGEPA
jgi:DNA-binding response OmpR family regulator